MVTRSLAAVVLGLGVLCMALMVFEAPSPKSGAFAIAGSILIGSGLIALAIESRR
jgi:membrane-bound ClpP family serine protease